MKKFILGCAGVSLLTCVVLVGVILYFYNKDSKRAEELYGKEIAEICNPPAGGDAAETNMPDDPRPLSVAVMDADSTFLHEWHDDLPSDFRAGNRDELRVVICVEMESQVVESCPYYTEDDSDKTFMIERVRQDAHLILLNAESGQRISELTVQGESPNECPNTARGRVGDTTQYKGDKPSYNDFLVAIQPLLFE
jgi:hypothetical protein